MRFTVLGITGVKFGPISFLNFSFEIFFQGASFRVDPHLSRGGGEKNNPEFFFFRIRSDRRSGGLVDPLGVETRAEHEFSNHFD